ncbi:MAG: T9SS type A sorting domain-containing protein [Bacteroidota bacterium]
MRNRILLHFTIFSIAIIHNLLIIQPVIGQTDRYWSGNGPSDNIDQVANWWGEVNPASGDNLYFNNTGTRHWAYSNYGAGSYFNFFISYSGANGIKLYGDNTYAKKFENNSDGSLLELSPSSASAGSREIGNRINNDLEINPVGTGGILVSCDKISMDNTGGARNLKVYGTNTLTVNGIIYEKNGTGATLQIMPAATATVDLKGNSTFTGLTTINGGVLQCDAAGGALLSTNAVTVNGGKLQIKQSQTLGNLTLTSGTLQVDAGQTLTINGTFDISGAATLSVSGTIVYGSGATLKYSGGGRTTSSTEWPATNSPANVIINTTSAITLNASKSIAGNLTINSGATLDVTVSNFALNIAGNWLNNGTFTFRSGTVTFNGGNQTLDGWANGFDHRFNILIISGTGEKSFCTPTSTTVYVTNYVLINANCTLTFNQTGCHFGSSLACIVDNYGTINLVSNYRLGFVGTFNNYGTFNCNAGLLQNWNIGTFNNTGTFNLGTGTLASWNLQLTFNNLSHGIFNAGTGTVDGTYEQPTFSTYTPVTFYNLTVGGKGFNLLNAGNTVNGTLKRICSDVSPGTLSNTVKYGPASTLLYSSGQGNFITGLEWSADPATSVFGDPGYPNNVTLQMLGQKQVILNGQRAVHGNLAIGAGNDGFLTVGANALWLNGSISRTTGGINASNAGATVIFTNSSPVSIPANTFSGNVNNLTINGSGGVILGSAITVPGTLSLTKGVLTNSSYLTMGTGATIFRTGGSFTAAPTFGSTAKVTYNSHTSAITTGYELPASASVLSDLTINNANGVVLNANATVNNTLALTSGICATQSNSLTIASGGSVSGTSGWINGNLRKFVPAALNPTVAFEVGDAAVYTPVSVAFTGTVSAATGSITAKSTAGDHPQIAASGIYGAKSVNRFWTLTNTTPIPGTWTYSPSFNYVATDNDAGTTPAYYLIRRYNSPDWFVATVSGTPTNLLATATGLTSFSDFAVGDPSPALTVEPGSLDFGLVPTGSTSAEMNYTLTGTNLDPASGNITITPPAEFEVSLTSGSGFSSSAITKSYTGGALAATTIYVRFVSFNPQPEPPAYFSGSISNSGAGAPTANVTVSGTASCAAKSIPFTENFDDLTPPAMSPCFTVENTNGDGVQWGTFTMNYTSAPNSASISNSSIAMDDWLFTPGLQLTGGKTYEVGFTYGAGNDFEEKLSVYWGNSPVSSAMTNGPIFDQTIQYANTIAPVSFTPATDGVYYIGFWGHSDANHDWLSIDDIYVTEALASITWNGSIDNDWHKPGNWNEGVTPASVSNVIIPAGLTNYPTVTQLTICNNIIMGSNATSTATLLNNSKLIVFGTAYVDRYFSGNDTDWHLVSSPVDEATAGVFTGMYLQRFAEGSSAYFDITIPATLLITMEGYGLYSTLSSSNTVTFTGYPNFGTFSKEFTATNEGWNLFGNPFPSSIDWEAVDIPAGMSNEVHFIRASDGNDLSYVKGLSGQSVSRYIPPMQGFFIKATETGTLTLGDEQRSHSGAGNFYKSENPRLVTLEATGANFSDQTLIHFNEQAGIEHDGKYDAYKIISASNPKLPQIYSVTPNGVKLSVNGMPPASSVPLGFTSGEEGIFTIHAIKTGDFSVVTLEDTKTGVFTDLTKSSYSFSFTPGENEQRFVLHFGALSVNEIENSIASVYSNLNTVYVDQKNITKGDILIYSISGQLVASKLSATGSNKISLASTGNYCVKVITNESTVVKKVFIH